MDGSELRRVITLIDMDCFYCQVELRLDPNLAGKPVAVVQYNQWKQGGIIAVNYEARDRGVNRFMRGEDAKKVCPELCLASVPSVRGKADLTRYREAGVEVANVFTEFSDCVERASVDEAFIDLTAVVEKRIRDNKVDLSLENLPATFVVGHSDVKKNDMDVRAKGTLEWIHYLRNNDDIFNPDYRLAVGALIVEEIRSEVFKKTGFHCSAGIAHNKILAKLVAGLHKPKCQTVLPHDSVPELYESVPIKKVRSLGGKFGKTLGQTLGISLMSELYHFTKEELTEKFNAKNASWLYNIARGIDHDPVTVRLIADSIGCSKNYPGPTAIDTKDKLQRWLTDMATEVVERLDKDLLENSRRAKLLTVSCRQEGATLSRSCPLTYYKVDAIAKDAYEILLKFNQASTESPAWHPPITSLGLSTSKFVCTKSTITKFLQDKANKYVKQCDNEPEILISDSEGPNDVRNNISGVIENQLGSDEVSDVEPKKGSIKAYLMKQTDSSTKSIQTSSKEIKPKKSSILSYFKDKSSLIEPALNVNNTAVFNANGNTIDTNSATRIELDGNNQEESDLAESYLKEITHDGNSLSGNTAVTACVSVNHNLDENEALNDGDAMNVDENSNESVESALGADLDRWSFEGEQRERERCRAPVPPDSSEDGDASNCSSCSAGLDGGEQPKSFFAKIIAQKIIDERKSPVEEVTSTVLSEGDSSRFTALPSTSYQETTDDLMQKCPDCSLQIHLSVYLEHLDYHEAVRVDKEINRLSVKTAIARPQSSKTKQSPAKKKRKLIHQNAIDQKEITKFFNVLPK